MCIKWQPHHMVSGGMTRPCSLRFSFVKAMIKLQRPCWDQGDRMWKIQKAWNNRCPLLCPCAHVPNVKYLENANEEHIHIIYLFLTRISIVLSFCQKVLKPCTWISQGQKICIIIHVPNQNYQMDNLSSDEHKYLAELLVHSTVSDSSTKKEMYH